MAAQKTKKPSPEKPVPRRRAIASGFDALSIEGGLLSPEWLDRIAKLSAGRQSESDYRIPKGLNLRDEIGRYWRVGQAHWEDFRKGLASGSEKSALTEKLVTALLRDCFGFTTLVATKPVVRSERTYPIGWHALLGRVPVVLAPAGSGLDERFSEFGDENRKRSAFGLAQEYLNVEENAHWGLASDGTSLRLLRDNASLTRPAWIHADLARIFSEQRYPDFTALWLLIHETRFGAPDAAPTDSPLEAWRTAGREEGIRAREHLRTGVEAALLSLGQGFLSHPANAAIRAAAEKGDLAPNAYYQELLRLAYRVIFLLAAEERGVLHPDSANKEARDRYDAGYSVQRLRDLAVRRGAHDRFHDLWDGLTVAIRGLAIGEPALGLPALAGIFAADRCPTLDLAKLDNRDLLFAILQLAWIRDEGGLSRVNWRDMGPEELGSVYESLLELVPRFSDNGRTFSFAGGSEAKGNERKKTGSYYTPESLVQVLLESALEPVVADAIATNPGKEVEALLALKIVDPACGSGHFLLSAARRLAAHIARLQAMGTPSIADYRHALRLVVSRCIFGVDLNPMAVELCKVSLWMEAVEPGLPLTFLDSHIQHGNALLGATPELMAKGVPEVAWEPIEGDDKKTAAALKKRNKAERESPNKSFDWAPGLDGGTVVLTSQVQMLDAVGDENLAGIEKKSSSWRSVLGSPVYEARRLAADAWCAAFVWPKQPGELASVAPTHIEWERLRHNPSAAPKRLVDEVKRLAEEYRFFHWHLQFPQVFAKGGFNVVLGNPPWEKVKLQEQEFFASRDIQIAEAQHAAARKKLIARLPEQHPSLWAEWCLASRKAGGESHVIRHSGRYPLCGKGDVNTYAVFAEHNRSILDKCGRAGFIVPTGLATDDTTKEYFGTLVDGGELYRLYSFENEEFVFPGVHHAFKFALLAIARSGTGEPADLVFFARQVGDLSDPSRHFSLSPSDFAVLNPNTRTCPTFRTRRDADINLEIYRLAGVLVRDDSLDGDPWRFRIHSRLWHMAEDADAFRTGDSLLHERWEATANRFEREGVDMIPLLEAKMLHHFDHRFGTYEGQTDAQANQGKLPEVDDVAHADQNRFTIPHYWVDGAEANRRLAEFSNRGWLLGWRKIARSTDQRTMIAVLFPRAAAGDATPLAFPDAPPRLLAALYANLCSFPLDYCARQKVGGTNVTFNYVKQFPVLAPDHFSRDCPWSKGLSYVDWLVPRVVELVYTALDLESFGQDMGFDCPPFRWDPARRFLLRCELDAAFFHMYGLSRDDSDYVMETFPIVRKNDEKAYGEYRTKRVIIEIYDELADAIESKATYMPRVDPHPADPRVAHPRQGTTDLPSRPNYSAEGDGARFIWAALYACKGKIELRELAAAFTLRSHPELLVETLEGHDHPKVATARSWGAKAPEAVPGFLIELVASLAGKGAISKTVIGGHAALEFGSSSPAAEKIEPWYHREAELCLAGTRILTGPESKKLRHRLKEFPEMLKLIKLA